MSLFDRLSHACLSDVGVRRSHNQDAHAALPAASREAFRQHGHIYIVADGMGGHAVGEKAAAKAARDIPLTYQKHARDGTQAALSRAFQEANAGIYEVGKENPEFAGMGTTATALVLTDEGAWVGHVGDSRAYRVRGGRIEQLSFDHSHVWEIARRRRCRPDQVTGVPHNRINRSLGPDPVVEVDVEGPHPVRPGDVYVLCSDGLSGLVKDGEIGAIAGALEPADASRLLVDLANLRGGPDNVTVMVVRVHADAAVELPPAPTRAARLRAAAVALAATVPTYQYPLAGGLVLALVAFYMAAGNTGGAAGVFVLALVAVVAGLVGLVRHVRKPPATPDAPRPRKLNLYARSDCAPAGPAADKLADDAGQLAAAVRARSWPADWAAFDAHRRAAADAREAGDPAAAYREHCRAFAAVLRAFHARRPKEEVFSPNWQSSG